MSRQGVGRQGAEEKKETPRDREIEILARARVRRNKTPRAKRPSDRGGSKGFRTFVCSLYLVRITTSQCSLRRATVCSYARSL